VLTHGFTVDEKGRKLSKSLGNFIAPQKLIGSLGADVLRLWVAATDYANEMSVSDEILKRMADSYRRIRNTVRFLLGNLGGFEPARDAITAGAVEPLADGVHIGLIAVVVGSQGGLVDQPVLLAVEDPGRDQGAHGRDLVGGREAAIQHDPFQVVVVERLAVVAHASTASRSRARRRSR